jgi:hypothetical protein
MRTPILHTSRAGTKPSTRGAAPAQTLKKVRKPALRLPHERDESIDSQQSKPVKIIKQAYLDVARGLEDTDLRGSQGVRHPPRAPQTKK